MKKTIAIIAVAMLLAVPVFAEAGTAGEINIVENEDGTKTMTVRPIEEAYTKEQDPNAVIMEANPDFLNIRSRANKTRNVYLKFDIKGLGSANIQSIELHMVNGQWKTEPPEGAKTGGDESFIVVKIDPNSWKQEELTFATAPFYDESEALIGECVQEGPMAALEVTKVELDPTFIKGDGLHSLALIPTMGEDDSQWFSTREAEVGAQYGPTLVITYTGGGAGATTLYIIIGAAALLVITGIVFFVTKKKAA